MVVGGESFYRSPFPECILGALLGTHYGNLFGLGQPELDPLSIAVLRKRRPLADHYLNSVFAALREKQQPLDRLGLEAVAVKDADGSYFLVDYPVPQLLELRAGEKVK